MAAKPLQARGCTASFVQRPLPSATTREVIETAGSETNATTLDRLLWVIPLFAPSEIARRFSHLVMSRNCSSPTERTAAVVLCADCKDWCVRRTAKGMGFCWVRQRLARRTPGQGLWVG
jgi:hypothetical protein